MLGYPCLQLSTELLCLLLNWESGTGAPVARRFLFSVVLFLAWAYARAVPSTARYLTAAC